MREVSHSGVYEGVLSSDWLRLQQSLPCRCWPVPWADQGVMLLSVSPPHIQRPHSDMTFTTAHTAGEGYQSSAISLNHIFATTCLQNFYEDLPNNLEAPSENTIPDGKTLCWKIQQCKWSMTFCIGKWAVSALEVTLPDLQLVTWKSGLAIAAEFIKSKTYQNTRYCVRIELSGSPESFPDEIEANQLSFHMWYYPLH